MLITADIKLLGITETSKPFSRIQDMFQAEDVVYGNLEGTLHDEIDPYEYFSKVRWVPPGTRGVNALRDINISAVGLANNVMAGEKGIANTISILDKMGIAHTGAGMNLGLACAPAIVEKNGVKYGFLQRTSIFWPYHHRAVPEGPFKMPPRKYGHGGYKEGEHISFRGAPGVATIRPRTAYEPAYSSIYEAGGPAIIHTWPDEDELASFVEDIKALRPQVDILVTANHWRIGVGPGNELARDFRIEVAHAAIDAGADIVASHGTHYLEEIEVYKGKAIFYGLGELYYGWTDGASPPVRPEIERVKLVAKVEVKDKKIAGVSAFPIISGGWPGVNGEIDQCEFKRPKDVPLAMDHILKKSAKFRTELGMEEDRIVVI